MKRPRQAVSLGEILLGVAILAVTFLAMIQMFPTSYAASDQSGDVITASHLAQACMDREMARSYDKLVSLPAVTETLTGSSLGATVSKDFSVSVQVNRPSTDRARITVSVQWKQRSQDLPKELRLESTRVRP
ncbi:hypothetical protein IV102_23610 [bacterium]|nr:hypothetical protein [bacterium]